MKGKADMSTSPAGSNAGMFQLCDEQGKIKKLLGVSGNARQRRRILRLLKKEHVVMQFNCETRAPRFRR